MKNKNIELDVDFIGGQGSLTDTEEKALSEFFEKKKLLSLRKLVRKTLTKKKKEHA